MSDWTEIATELASGYWRSPYDCPKCDRRDPGDEDNSIVMDSRTYFHPDFACQGHDFTLRVFCPCGEVFELMDGAP